MKIKYKIYFFLSLVYLFLSIWYLCFLIDFDCDGIGCLSIFLFTGPIIIGFIISFIILLFKTFKYFNEKGIEESLVNRKMSSLMLRLGIPFWLFTAIVIFIVFDRYY
jgi:hypothetical protein